MIEKGVLGCGRGGVRARVEGQGVRVGAGGRGWRVDVVPKVQMCGGCGDGGAGVGGGSRAHTRLSTSALIGRAGAPPPR